MSDRTPAPEPSRGARRFWAARRVPATLLALVVLGGSGLLLYDVAAVRAERPGMRWRRFLADELATRPLNDHWVLIGAAVAVLLGLWLLLLACTPGLRRMLPMRRDAEPVRAGLSRDSVAEVLRDRALDVPGVQSVRVRARRRRVGVRAVSHFRELEDVRNDVTAAVRAGIGELGLARPPAPAVRVTRAARKKG
ncbi:DUF6286 domain-containing protein [Streptomyces sp. LP05-1]|uniref:DUF6286 domain-containing protein n=1 Tax=Streptomyces pyxinae TaxID=2970734 RepID=A0ABT2CIN8_9ACTN|nr:DUF6286 domain-containing protein [Streptomyces sp. LP05-1]MCS0637266.1 DUF6286 domain-containing protein [Streptomyces sp. LP05-1]